MAAPNIVNVATITGKTAVAVLTTSAADIISNTTANSVYKVNNVAVANYTSTAITCTVTVVRSATSYYLAGTITVPANSTLVVVGKDTGIYLEESDKIQALASAGTSATIIASYEIIS